MNLSQSDLEEICEKLLDDFDGVFSWKWDNRFDALLAEFSTDREEEIRTILERHLKLEWDQKSIRKAPENIKMATGDFGDLRSNQLLFTSEPEGEFFIFAAWWPWGNGEVVSVRIASPSVTPEKNGASPGIFAKLKNFFG